MTARRRRAAPRLAAASLAAALAAPAAASAEEVGLGLALGASYSPTALAHGSLRRRAGDSLAGGFFVDVPLTERLVLSPAATLWGADFGEGKKPATDLDVNLKGRLTFGALRVAGGLGVGLSHLDRSLAGHLGLLALVGAQVSERADIFVQLAYKHVVLSRDNLENLHGLAGAIFYF